MTNPYKHLFGPVPSRRLGRSLGIDLVPFKTCSFDCIFCQLGRTTDKTVDRRIYVPTQVVLDELARWLESGEEADMLTLSGSGEPTLHAEFGRVVDFVHANSRMPVGLLTNGSLLSCSDVRRQAAKAEVVKVSLSAADDTMLEHVNRPHPSIEFASLCEGIHALRSELPGQLWLEVFLVWGTNATPGDIAPIAERVRAIGADKVQLNTAVRPPCEDFVNAVPQQQMHRIAELFDPPAEVIAEYSADTSRRVRADEDALSRLLERRPCTLDQICSVFGLHRNEVLKVLGKLTRTGRVLEDRRNNQAYYRAARAQDQQPPQSAARPPNGAASQTSERIHQ